MLELLEPILLINILFVFNLAYDMNGVPEEGALRLLHLFMKCPSVATLNTRSELRSKLHKRHKERPVTSYCESVYTLPETYATDNVITKNGC